MSDKKAEILALLRKAKAKDPEFFAECIEAYLNEGQQAIAPKNPGQKGHSDFVLGHIWWRVELEYWKLGGGRGDKTKALHKVADGLAKAAENGRKMKRVDFTYDSENLDLVVDTDSVIIQPQQSYETIKRLHYMAEKRRNKDQDAEFIASTDWFLAIHREAERTGKSPFEVATRS